MAHSKETIEMLKSIADNQYKNVINTLETLLSHASTKYIDDEILTIAVSEEEKKVYDNSCTVIDVPYPNEKGFISIYVIGTGFTKLKIKD